MNFPYVIRNEQGVMIAKLSARDAGELIDSIKGHWRPYRGKDGTSANVYQIDADMVVTFAGVRFYLWAGYVVIREI